MSTARESNGVILVTGAHGVGKTRLLQSASISMGIRSYTAGELIRLGRENNALEDTKIVNDVAANQQILISTIHQILRHTPTFILDGHTVLLTSEQSIETVDIDYFQRMCLLGVVLLDSDPRSVARNLLARDGASSIVSQVRENLRLERQYSAIVADYLGIPYSRVMLQYNDADISSLTNSIREVMRGLESESTS